MQQIVMGQMGNKTLNLQSAPNATVNMVNNLGVSMPNAMSIAPNNGNAQQINAMQQGMIFSQIIQLEFKIIGKSQIFPPPFNGKNIDI
jgi:hypothetical protein